MQETQETQVWLPAWEDPLEEAWQRTSVFLPGKSHGQRSLAGHCLWGHKESGHEHDWTCTHLTLGGLATNARREEDSEVASALPACCPSSAFLWPREWNKQNAVLRILPWGRNWEIFESNTLAFKWRNIHLKETVRSVLCSHFSTWKCKPPRRSEGWNSQKKETCSTGNPKRRNGLVN